jgi:hypothetical protein
MITLLLFWIAVFAFIASLITHLLTFTNPSAAMISCVWPLHLGAIVMCICMAIAQKRVNGPYVVAKGKDRKFQDMFPLAPPWMGKLLSVCFFYLIANFVIFVAYSIRAEHGGHFSIQGGQPAIMQHGNVVRTITQAEYDYHEARVARGFSGHWMGFFWIAVIGLYDAHLRKRPDDRAMPRVAPAPPSLPHLQRQCTDSPRLGPATHRVLCGFAIGIGFFAFPVSALAIVFSLHIKPGCFFALVWLFSGVAGAIIFKTLFDTLIPARCPACGDRTFPVRSLPREAGGGTIYNCNHCGYSHLQT